MRISALVLAAGESKRFGENKLFVDFKGKALILWTLEIVKDVDFHERVIVLNPENLELFLDLPFAKIDGFEIILNEGYREGMASSIRAGMDHVVNSKSDAVMIFLSDMPCVKKETINFIAGKAIRSSKKLIVPKYGMRRGNPVVVKKDLYYMALSLKGDHGMRRMIDERADLVEFVQVDDPDVVFDVDRTTDVNR